MSRLRFCKAGSGRVSGLQGCRWLGLSLLHVARGSWRSCTWFERLRGCEGAQHAACARRLDGFTACAACQRAALLSHALPSCSWLFLALFIISQPPRSPTLEIKMNSLHSAAGTSPHLRVPAAVLSRGNRAGRGRLNHPQLSGVRGSCREGFLLALRQQRMRWGASWHRTGRLLAAQPSCQPSVGSIYGASGWGLALASPPGTGTLCRPCSLPALPNVPRDGGLFRKIPGKVGLQHPARKGDVLCRGWFGSGAGRLCWTSPHGHARAPGADHFIGATPDRNQQFFMKHYFCCGIFYCRLAAAGGCACPWLPQPDFMPLAIYL